MRKSLLLLFLASALWSSAEVISPEAALRRAVEQPDVMAMSVSHGSEPKLVYTQKLNSEPSAYLFDKGNGNGYLVVSADDQVAPLLGYADKGSIDADNLPDGLKYWLSYYAAEIEAVRNGAVTALSAVRAADDKTPIEPMLSTLWNQSSPYNNLCPMDNGERSVTGCVATAMAQVMKYHNWPPKGTGSHSYTWNSTTLSQDYSQITYDWNNMLNVYDSSATEAQNNAVATLMYSCGVSVNMNYGSDSSGAISMLCGTALVDYFNYDASLRYLEREFYALSDWEDDVYNSLTAGCPVLYGGQSDAGGHEFVCDGYSHDGYFHFNWGWGGMSDGYFRLTSLNPGSQGIGGAGDGAGFNFDQDIIVGIKPYAGQSNFQPGLNNVSDFKVGVTSAELGTSISVTVQFNNGSYSTVSFTPGIAITDAAGNTTYVEWGYSNSLELQPGYGYTNPVTYNVPLPANLSEGSYTVAPAFKSDDKWYLVTTKLGCVGNVAMTVAGTKATFSSPVKALPTVSDISFVNPKFYAGKPFDIKATIKCNGELEYYGEVSGLLITSSGNYLLSSMMFDLQPGESREFDLTGSIPSQVAAGDYQIAFVVKNSSGSYTPISDYTDVTVNAAPASTQLSLGPVSFLSGSNHVPKSDLGVKTSLTCSSGVYYGPLDLVVYYNSSGSTWSSCASFSSENLYLEQGQTADVVFHSNFEDGNVGQTYLIMFFCGNTRFSNQEFIVLENPITSVEAVEGDDEPGAVELFNISGQRVSGQPLPGHYIKVKRSADGSTSSEHVIIR